MLNQIEKILLLKEVGSVNRLLQKHDRKMGVNEEISEYS